MRRPVCRPPHETPSLFLFGPSKAPLPKGRPRYPRAWLGASAGRVDQPLTDALAGLIDTNDPVRPFQGKCHASETSILNPEAWPALLGGYAPWQRGISPSRVFELRLTVGHGCGITII